MKKIPVIDLGKCNECESCLEMCPTAFRRNKETGYFEVIDLPVYPEEGVEEAMSMWPTDCITWEEVETDQT